MNVNALEKILEDSGQPKFRFEQILEFYLKNEVKSWDDFNNIPKKLRINLELVQLNVLEIELVQEDNEVIKILFNTIKTEEKIEGVIMKHKTGRRTLCLSCQAGCPMGCRFCATGTMGLKKSLDYMEMLEMFKLANELLKDKEEKITNIVFMGMGEPFANYDNIKQALIYLNKYFEIGWRKMSVSTCGIIPKILEFAKDFPQVNLAISLHATTQKKRTQLMPINEIYKLENLMKVSEEYVKLTNRKLFFEYLLIKELNDTDEDVKNIKIMFKNRLFHLNLIRFHETEVVNNLYGIQWKAPSHQEVLDFMDKLYEINIKFTLRTSFGENIDAACGMLALTPSRKV